MTSQTVKKEPKGNTFQEDLLLMKRYKLQLEEKKLNMEIEKKKAEISNKGDFIQRQRLLQDTAQHLCKVDDQTIKLKKEVDVMKKLLRAQNLETS